MANVVFTVYSSYELKKEIEQRAVDDGYSSTNSLIKHLLELGFEEYKKRELEKFQD